MSSALRGGGHHPKAGGHHPKAPPFAFAQSGANEGASDDASRRPSTGARPSSKGRQAPFAHHSSDDDRSSEGAARPATAGGFALDRPVLGGDADSSTALAEAAKKGLDALKAEFMESGGSDINTYVTCDGITKATPLMLAIDNCSMFEIASVVEMLLLHRADANAADCPSGDTPLMYAVQREKPNSDPRERAQFDISIADSVRVLLDHNADPAITNKRGKQNTLDIIAATSGNAENHPLGRACIQELNLRKKELSLPMWHKGEVFPSLPKGLAEVAKAAKDGHRRVAAYLKAYTSALEVAKAGIKLEFPPDSVGFVPASAHSATAPLRDALSAADAFLRDFGPLPDALHNLVFDALLPLQKEVYAQYIDRYSSKESQEGLVQFVAANKDAYLNGYDWAFGDLIEKKEKDDLTAAVALSEKFPKGKGDAKPRQKVDNFAKVMEGAYRCHRRVLLLCSKIAKRVKGTHQVVHQHDGGRGVPNQKGMFRAHEKVCLGSGYDGILDCARGGIECPSMASVTDALQALLDASDQGVIRLLRIKMRFHEPSDGGWRDALVNFSFKDDPQEHVCELQVIHEKMMTIRADMGAHHGYDKFRGALELLLYHDVDIEAVSQELADRAAMAMSMTLKSSMTAGSEALPAGDAARIAELEEQLRSRDAKIEELEKQLEERDKLLASASKAKEKNESKPLRSLSIEDQVLAAFKRWDVNGDGTISRSEVADVFSKIDPSFTDEDYDRLFQAADKDGNGKIDYQEFVMFIFQATSTANGSALIA